MDRSLSRRSFIKATALSAGAATVAGFGLTGCSKELNQEKTDDVSSASETKTVTAEYDCDILVAGLGMSGLTAVVQAAVNGAKVIGIEKEAITGGDGIGVEGIFAVDSSMTKEQKIHVNLVDIVQSEVASSQYVAAGNRWIHLLRNSGANVDWLIEQGVSFSGVVDDYLGHSAVPGFHWFEGNFASVGFVPNMEQRAREFGADLMLNTPINELIIDGSGRVTGAYALADGDLIRINSKAVILATGSWGENEEFIKQRGFNLANLRYGGAPGHTGDGIKIALAIGARSLVPNSTWNCTNTIGDFDFRTPFIWNAGGGYHSLFLNEDAERFINEDFADKAHNFELQSVPAMTQKQIYSVFDQKILETWLADFPEALAEVEATQHPDLAIGDTLDEVAGKLGIDPVAFKDSVQQYNSMCAAGSDTDFGKDPQLLMAIETPPFYIGRLTQMLLVAIGGIETNKNFQAVNENRDPILGLYAVGTDGCMNYRNIYTINVGGTCNANNINSGRVAANHACENL